MTDTPPIYVQHIGDLVDRIHASPVQAVIIVTGGGAGVFNELLHRGGGSATLISGSVPWSAAETVELLGGKPDKMVSTQTARGLAMAAYQRALKLRESPQIPVIGVACTSILQRVPFERVGRQHAMYLALQTARYTMAITRETTLHKMPADTVAFRILEEENNVIELLNLIAKGCDIKERAAARPLVIHHSTILGIGSSKLKHPDLVQLLHGEIGKIRFLACLLNAPLQLIPTGSTYYGKAILSGSFNPVHDGHLEMAKIAEQELNCLCDLEISLRNVQKPNLDFLTIDERFDHLANNPNIGTRAVWLTNAPTFAEKAALFPGACFVVGYDTAVRICDPQYGSLDQVFAVFQKHNISFLVFGREIGGVYHDNLLGLPSGFQVRARLAKGDRAHSALSSSSIRQSTVSKPYTKQPRPYTDDE